MLHRHFRKLALAWMLVLATALAAGCGDDNPTAPNTETNDAPALPSLNTMQMSLDFFGVAQPAMDTQSVQTGKPSDTLVQHAAAINRSNWINAVVRALYVQLITYDLLEEPIAAFALAIHSVPQEQPDGSYLWTYIFVEDDGTEYNVFLYGTVMLDRVMWRMEVSSNSATQPLDHFVWFDGETMNDDSAGFWQFYEPVDQTSGVASARIDYTNSAVENTLRVSVNGVGHEDEGDYLEFRETPTSGSIEHLDASTTELSRIDWAADGSGSIMVPDYNGGVKACWDINQEDAVCPQ